MAIIPLDKISTNPQQPRTVFPVEELANLALSLARDGLLNPISLEGPYPDGHYILLDGERRWRAAKLAGWTEIEANIRLPLNGTSEQDRLMLALVGNLQREDMPPVDEARAFKKLTEMGFNQAEIATRIGKSQSLVSTLLRLLEFSPMVQDSINQGRLPCDERVLSNLRKLDIDQQESVARAVANRKMAPAAIMGICARINHQKTAPRAKAAASECPSLEGRKLEGRFKAVEPLIRQTCKACGLYADGGDRKICPSCPVIILAGMMEGN